MLEGDLGYQEFDRQSGGRIERDGNVAHVYKPEGLYSIVYNVHGLRLGVESARAPDDSDIVFFENVVDWSERPLDYLRGVRSNRFYVDAITALEERGGKAGFNDCAFVLEPEVLVAAETALATFIEGFAGMGLALEAFKIPLSRRTFLKIGTLGLAGWFLMPISTVLAGEYSRISESGEEAAARYHKLTEDLHPEFFFFAGQLRNAVIAHKLQWLMESDSKRYRHISQIIGSLHIGIETKLLDGPGRRLSFLTETQRIWQPIVKPETFYKTALFAFEGQQWEVEDIVEHSDLKSLVSS